MTEAPTPRDDDAQDALRRYLGILLKRKWFVLAVTVLVVGATSAWTFTRRKIYAASATVLFDKRAPQVLGKDVREVVDMSMGNFWRSKEYLETQRRVLLSKSLARKVVNRAGLVSDDAFWPKNVSPAPARTVENAMVLLRAAVQVEPVKGADLLRVKVRHEDAVMAARLANAITKTYMDQNLEYKASSGVHAVKWLADQLDDLKKKLEGSELKLHEFKRKHKIVSISFEDRQTLLSRRITKIDETLTDLRTKRLILAAERREAHKARSQDPMTVSLPKVRDSLTFPTLKEVYKRERTRYLAILERYGPKHPLVRQQQTRLNNAKADLKRELATIIDSYEVEYRQLRNAEATLAAMVEAAKKALDLNRKELVYNRLKRNKDNTAKLYGSILSRLRETGLTSQLRVSNMRLLDRAVASPTPISPRVKLNLLIGLFFGLLLGIGLAILLDAFDTSIKSQEDLVGRFAFLGVVPRIPGAVVKRRGRRPAPNPELDLTLHKNPKSSYAEAWRSVRTNLLFSSPDEKLQTLMVTSPNPREGKTTTAVSLAIAMSQSGSRVLLIDTDMRRPRLHRIFGVPGGDGLTSLLVGDKTIEEVVKTTEVTNLHLLPCGPTPPNPAEICQSERFREIVAHLGERFDQLILDSPPVTAVTDAVVLSTLMQGVIVIARTGATSRDAFAETMRQLNDVGASRIACVLNDMDLDRGGYGYRRYGYYRRSYGYGRYGYGHYGDEEEPAKS